MKRLLAKSWLQAGLIGAAIAIALICYASYSVPRQDVFQLWPIGYLLPCPPCLGLAIADYAHSTSELYTLLFFIVLENFVLYAIVSGTVSWMFHRLPR